MRAPGDSVGCVEEEKNGGEDPDGAAQYAKHQGAPERAHAEPLGDTELAFEPVQVRRPASPLAA
jgi:hypothetical protein